MASLLLQRLRPTASHQPLRLFTPTFLLNSHPQYQPPSHPHINPYPHLPSSAASASSPFSTSAPLHRSRGKRDRPDQRITNIRYFLSHPKQPRPLRFSRLRSLRHWTIHRAWQLYTARHRRDTQLELERQFMSMKDACEALRLIGEDGLAVTGDGNKAVLPPGARDAGSVTVKASGGEGEAREVVVDVGAAARRQKEVGRLFRIGMMKDQGVWDVVPIEYARTQVETPSRAGWDHAWKRG